MRFRVELEEPPAVRPEDPTTSSHVPGRLEYVGRPFADYQHDTATDVTYVLASSTPASVVRPPGGIPQHQLTADGASLGPVIADALVLLGCRIGPGALPGGAAARRARAAARAWHERVAPIVIVSGGRRWAGVAESEALAAELERLGVAPAALVTELCSLSTHENARYSAEILQRRGARRAAIVTCDWHLPRALACFRALGVEAVGIAAPSPPTTLAVRARRAVSEWLGRWLDALVMGGSGRS